MTGQKKRKRGKRKKIASALTVNFALTGPPTAPRITASAFFAADKASSVSGVPVASIEAWRTRNPLISNSLRNRKTELSTAPNLRIQLACTHPAKQVILELELDIISLFLNGA